MNDMNDVYRASRTAFDRYAGMGGPQLPEDSVSAAQVRAFRWGVHNFGCEQPSRYVMGLAEEIGEMHAAEDEEARYKEVGDVMICAAQLCTCFRLDFNIMLRTTDGDARLHTSYHNFALALSQLARAVLKGEQGIRGMDDHEVQRRTVAIGLHALCAAIRNMCPAPEQLFVHSVNRVVLRDYIKHPVDGGR